VLLLVVAAGLLDPAEFRRLARIARSEVVLAMVAMVNVVAVGMLAAWSSSPSCRSATGSTWR
jgi:MFS superfamily sulfate permease-like transporter